MSEKEDDIFKELFQKEFLEHREPVEDINWDLIGARLEKKRFYKFSLSRFNIYYSVLIISMFSISIFSLFVWLGEKGYLNPGALLRSNSSVRTIDSSETKIIDPIPVSTTESDKSKKATSINNVPSKTKSIVATDTKIITKANDTLTANQSSPVALPKTDSSVLTPAKEIVRPIKKKTIYVVKQDTLIKVDTVRSDNKRKKKK